MVDRAQIKQLTKCNTPDKRRFRSKAEAKKFNRRYPSRIHIRLWPYLCVCGEHWHLTNQNPEEQVRIRRQIDRNLGRLEDWQQ